MSINLNEDSSQNLENIIISQPPPRKSLLASQLCHNLYPNNISLFRSKAGLFQQVLKVRKITNPTKEEGDDDNSSSSSSSSSSSPASHIDESTSIEPLSDMNKQFHPLAAPVVGSPLDTRLDIAIMKRGVV
jgi:hypothetical protein